VHDGQVLARGRNLGRTDDDPTAHRETMAIRLAWPNMGVRVFEAARCEQVK
jgi:tRNA(Arg) A34 adenosine deaminase TadA